MHFASYFLFVTYYDKFLLLQVDNPKLSKKLWPIIVKRKKKKDLISISFNDVYCVVSFTPPVG